jgi:flagellar biosynthesis protein FlhF
MQVKRVTAKDMQQALKIVRDELGADAIILSNKKVSGGVELLCTLDTSVLDDSRLEQLRISRQHELRQKATIENVSVSDVQNIPLGGRSSAAADPRAYNGPAKKKESFISPLARELQAMQDEARKRARQIQNSMHKKTAKKSVEATGKDSAGKAKEQVATLEVDENSDWQSLLTQSQDNKNLHDARHDTSRKQENRQEHTPDKRDIHDNREELLNRIRARSSANEHSALAGHSSASVGVEAERDKTLTALKSELHSMRQMLQQQLSSDVWRTFKDKNPMQALLWKRLSQMGLSSALMQELIATVADIEETEQAWFSLLTQLAQRIRLSEQLIVEQGGVHAFVGPTGVGKTTTIVKLATQYVLKNGPQGVVLLTIDTHRIAAHEQLRVFGRILNVPVKVIDRQDNLAAQLHALRKKSLVLIDTAGLNANDPLAEQQLQHLQKLQGKGSIHLVLSTAAQSKVNEAAYSNYSRTGLSSCILTKLDETACLGGVISLVISKNLPLSYVTNGQKIPEDISVAKGRELAAQMVKLSRKAESDEQLMIDQFSRAWPNEGEFSQNAAAPLF